MLDSAFLAAKIDKERHQPHLEITVFKFVMFLNLLSSVFLSLLSLHLHVKLAIYAVLDRSKEAIFIVEAEQSWLVKLPAPTENQSFTTTKTSATCQAAVLLEITSKYG